MLNINCSKCGQGLKNVYYYEGKPYGRECFKAVSGVNVEEYKRMKTVEETENKVNNFIINNPVLYVVLDKYVDIDYLKELGYQKRLGYWIGFILVDYNTISFMTKEVFKGFTGEYNNLYSINTNILTIIEDAEEKLIDEQEQEYKKALTNNTIETIKTENLTIKINKLENEIYYVIETNNGYTFNARTYGDYENTKGVKGIRNFKAEFENVIDTQEMINKYLFD